jgi:hypothetical protein
MSNLSISQLPSSSGLTGTEVLPIVQSGVTVQTTVQDVANLGGLSGTNYVYVYGNGTPLENGQELLNGYTRAKEMVNYIPPEDTSINIDTINVFEDNWNSEDNMGYWLTDPIPFNESMEFYLNFGSLNFSRLLMNPPLFYSMYNNEGFNNYNGTLEIITDIENNTYQIGYTYYIESDSRFGEYTDVKLVPSYNYNSYIIENFEVVVSAEGYWESAVYNIEDFSPSILDYNSCSIKIGDVYYTDLSTTIIDETTFYFYQNTEILPEIGTYTNVEVVFFVNPPNSFQVNEISLIIGPGNYEFTESWVVDIPMHIVSLTGNEDVNLFISGESETPSLIFSYNQVNFALNDYGINYVWKIKGIVQGRNKYVQFQPIKINTSINFIIENCISLSEGGFSSDDGYALNVDFINCKGDYLSFNAQVCNGTYNNCISGGYSFGYQALEINGVYNNCSFYLPSTGSGWYCFGFASVNCFGNYRNCVGARGSFGRECELLAGTFDNCIGDRSSFGFRANVVTSTFKNCKDISNQFTITSFACDVKEIVSSIFINCEVRSNGSRSFCFSDNFFPTVSSTFINCISGGNSFCYDNDGGNMIIENSLFLNCVAGFRGFGYGNASSTNNSIINCVSSNQSFSLNGQYDNCIGGNSFRFLNDTTLNNCKNINNSGFVSLVNCNLYNCISGSESFYGEGNKFYNCVGEESCFQTVNGTSNEYNNCDADLGSFSELNNALNPTLSKLYFCHLRNGAFVNSTGTGLIRQSIDGDNVLINQG